MSSTNPLLATADTQPTIPLPQTPSRCSWMSVPVSGMYNMQLERKNSIYLLDRVAGHTSTDHPTVSQPQTPSWCSTMPKNLPETPRRRKGNANQRLQGIKAKLPDNLSLDAIWTRLVSILKLSYTPDDWQVHLIRRILQGYDSIFCAGTGYGKSLIFEGLAVLGGG